MFTKENLPNIMAVAGALGGAYWAHKNKKSLLKVAIYGGVLGFAGYMVGKTVRDNTAAA